MIGVGLHQLFQPVFGPQGGSGSANSTTQKTDLPAWMLPYAKGTMSFAQDVANQPYKPYSGNLVAGLTPEQQQAYKFTGNQLGVAGNQIQGFMQGMKPLTSFQPQNVSAGSYDPMQVNASQVNASQVNAAMVDAARVKAGQLSQTDLQPYMDPYTHRVVNTSLAALDRSRQQQQMQNAANASSAGAFGGSRQGIVQAQTNEAAQRQAGALSAGLYSQGFQNAQQAAQQDIQSRMQAAFANQQTGLQAGLANQQMGLEAQRLNQATGLQAQLANQQTGMQAQLANQQAGLTAGMGNQQMALQAALANQQAGIQGAGVRMDAGRLGAMMAGQGQQANLQSAAALEAAGQAQQQQRQAQISANYNQFLEKRGYPEQQLNIMLRALGMPAGQTTMTTGPAGNPWMSALGGAMGGAGLGGALGGPWGMGLGALGGGLMGMFG